MRTLTLATVALLMAAATTQAAPLDPAHLPAGAKWVIHVDIEQIHKSDLVEACMAKFKENDKAQKKVKEITEKLGMNPMKDLLGVTIFDTEYGSRKGVVLIHCNKLDRKKLHAIFEKKHPKHKTTKYGNWTLNTWTEKKRGREMSITGTFANDNTIALSGSADKLKKALDVIAGKGKALGSDAKLVDGLGKKAIMVARAMDVDAAYMKKTKCPVLRNCTAATVVWSEKKGQLIGQYALTTDTEDTAKSFKAVVEGMKGLASLRFGSNKDVAKLMDGLKVKAKGTAFNLTYKAATSDIIAVAKKMKDMRKKWGHRHHHKHKDSKKKEI